MVKKILALLLALLMLMSVTVACSKNDGEADESSSESQSVDVSGSEDLYDENGYLKDELPELDYGGYEFDMLGWSSPYRDDFWVAEPSLTSVVETSVYNRNETVEERLNVTLEATYIAGDYNHQSEFISYVTNTAYSGADNEFDLICSYSMCGATLAMNGITCNLYDLEYLDFDKPWWPEKVVERSEMGGSLYFVTGDAANSYLYALNILSVNLNMLDELHLDDPREMVKNGTWTLEKMIEMTKDVGKEADGETGKTAGDIYGYSYYSIVQNDCWLAASGMRISEENSDGVLALTEDFMGEKVHTLLTTVATQSKTGDWYHTHDASIYINGNSLFGGVAIDWLDNINAKAIFKYGVLPFPKVLEGQEEYYTLLGFNYTNFSVPTNAKDPDMSSAVLECMGSEAYRYSTPVLFETVVKSRFSSSPIDQDMFEIIRSGAYVDAARLFHGVMESNFGWRGTPTGLFRSSVTSFTDKSTWISDVNGIKYQVNQMLANISHYMK